MRVAGKQSQLDIDITGLLLEVQLRFNFLIQFFLQ